MKAQCAAWRQLIKLEILLQRRLHILKQFMISQQRWNSPTPPLAGQSGRWMLVMCIVAAALILPGVKRPKNYQSE
jgi:hypothetical protein